jgi:DNA-binding transcriptional regulator YhcF (GntR family)
LIESINKGLKELIDNNLITKLGSDKVNEYEIDITNLSKESKPKDYYTTIEEDNVNVILKHSNQHIGTTLSMLRFYVYLMSTVHKKGSLHEGVGFTQLSDMAEITSINEKTIRSYLQKLETMKLVYTYHATKSIVFNSGEIREISSAYGEYKNKYKIIQVGQEYESKYGSDFQTQFKKLSRKELNKTRGLSQKYNHIVMCQLEDKEIPYTYEECKLIYDAMVEYNEKYKFRPERIKDLSVFK